MQTMNKPMNRQELLGRVKTLTGIGDEAGAERAVRAVVSVLGEQLANEDRRSLARVLPEPWADAIPGTPLRVADDLPAFYERVSSREGIEPGFAVEHAQSVCLAISEALSDDRRKLLAARLPDALAPLLELAAPERAPAGPARRTSPRPAQTLAEGRPGGSRPVSESQPGSTRPLSETKPERVQQDSVASDENPHGDTKLSTTRGTTQERERETLAEGETPARKRRADRRPQ